MPYRSQPRRGRLANVIDRKEYQCRQNVLPEEREWRPRREWQIPARQCHGLRDDQHDEQADGSHRVTRFKRLSSSHDTLTPCPPSPYPIVDEHARCGGLAIKPITVTDEGERNDNDGRISLAVCDADEGSPPSQRYVQLRRSIASSRNLLAISRFLALASTIVNDAAGRTFCRRGRFAGTSRRRRW